MNRVFSVIIICFFLGSIHAQHANFNTQRNWSLHKKELQIGIGATQFNGDLGGAEGIGRDYSLKDINWPATGVAFWLGYRQRFHPYFATTSSLCVFNLKGADSLSANANRNARNLHFRSLGVEIQQRIEWIFATPPSVLPPCLGDTEPIDNILICLASIFVSRNSSFCD